MVLFEDVKSKVLDNGLEILVREDPSAPVVALNFFVRVGSLNEDDAIAGWSHGIEHMLFKGTERRGPGDIAREITNAGGETNAGTGYESTNYYITLPAENFRTALDIHADVLQRSTFDEFELEKERQVLIKENEMYRDRPTGYGFTWEHLLEEAFTTHRYKRPIGGPDENLLRVGRGPIMAHKEKYYVPNNITYVVVGDVKAEEVFAAVEEMLGGWPRREVDFDRSPAEPAQDTLRYRETSGDVEKSYVKIGFHIPPQLHPDTDSLMVLANVLAAGRSSRLYTRVREEQDLILDSHLLESSGREPGYLAVEFTAEPEKTDAALEAVMTQILRFQVETATAAELERTMSTVRSDTLYTLETMEGQAAMLGHYALLGDYKLAGTYLERMSRVTPARVQEAARRYLNLEQATVYIHAPAGKRPNPPSPQALYDRLREAVAPSLRLPAQKANGVTAESKVPQASGTRRRAVEAVTLDAGTRVLLQRDGRLPLTALAAYLPVGSGVEGSQEAGITRLTQNGMLKGAGGRSAADISEALERMGARLRPFTSRDVSGFSLSAVRDDVPQAMDLFRTVLGSPDFPEEAVERERHRTLAEIASLRDDTMQFTLAEFFRLVFPGHAYGRPVLGTEEAVRGITTGALHAWHRRMYDPSRMVVSVVGDFEREAILRMLQETMGALPRTDEPWGPVPPSPAPERSVRADLHKDVSQAVVVLGYAGPSVDSPDRYALDVWNGVMSGMGNRLFTRLRDERHLCYFTGAFVAPLARGGTIGAYVGTGPDQVGEATDALLEEIDRAVETLPTEEELRRAKNNLAGSYLIDMQSRMSWASTYARDEILGLGYEEALRYVDEVRKVTGEMARDAAARYVDPERMALAVLRPAGDSLSVGEEVGA
jgi:zinc protease